MFGATISELRAGVATYVAAFDASLITPADAVVVVDEAARIEKMAATLKALAAARAAETDLLERDGDAGPAHALARRTGTSVSKAADVLRTGRSTPAPTSSVPPAPVGNTALTPRRRRLRPTRPAPVWKRALTPAGGGCAGRRARRGERWRRPTGLGLDAPVTRAGTEPVAPASGSPPGRVRSPVPTRIVVRVDWPALARGLVAGDEVCEITGIGPVPVSVVRAMMATGDAFLAAVVTKGVDVVSVAHLGRRATVYQSTALDWTSPTCVVLGCDAVVRLETDHRVDWADTRMTWLEWLERMCECHHDKKTYDGWALVAGTGKRAMVAPDDPRHPRHQTG